MREELDNIHLLKVLAKKNNYLVMKFLYNHGKSYFKEIKTGLRVDGKVVNRALEELVKAGLVQKEIEEPAKRTSKVYYSLTELGKEAIKVYEYVEELEKKRKSHIAIENSKDVYFAVGDNNIVAKNVNIKK